MKRMLKSFLLIAMLLSTVLFAVACTNRPLDVTNMTSKQLIREAKKQESFPISDFYVPYNFGIKLESGETWHQLQLNSAKTNEEARQEVEVLAEMQNPDSVNIDFIGENEYFYQYKLKYTHRNAEGINYILRTIVYKESAKLCSFNSQSGYNLALQVLDKDSVQKLMDLQVFFDSLGRVIQRELTEHDNSYLYTYYEVSVTYGDWGLSNVACLYKQEYSINKATGTISRYSKQLLKQAVIPGTRNNGGGA